MLIIATVPVWPSKPCNSAAPHCNCVPWITENVAVATMMDCAKSKRDIVPFIVQWKTINILKKRSPFVIAIAAQNAWKCARGSIRFFTPHPRTARVYIRRLSGMFTQPDWNCDFVFRLSYPWHLPPCIHRQCWNARWQSVLLSHCACHRLLYCFSYLQWTQFELMPTDVPGSVFFWS